MTAARLRRLAPLLVMVGGFLYLLRATAQQWFFFDDWDFVKEGAGTLPWAPFTPHNGHPSLLPKLLYDGLYAVLGLHRYWPYMVFVLLAHVAVAELTRRVLVRAGAGELVGLAAMVLVILMGAGWENIIWAFQVGFVGSLACGLGALLLLDSAARYRRVAAAVLLVLGLQMSSVGAVMLLAAAMWMLLRGRLRWGWPVLAAPAVLYAAWLVVERHSLGQHGSLRGAATGVPRGIWSDVTGAYTALSDVGGVGILLGIVLFALLVRHVLGDRRAMALPVSLALAAVAFVALVTVERTSTGLSQGTEPRYVYVVVVLSLPLLLTGVVRLGAPRGRAHPLLAGAVALGLLAMAGYNWSELHSRIDFWTAVKQNLRTRVLATALLLQHGDHPLSDDPEPDQMPQLQWTDVARFLEQRSLPAADGVTPAGVLTAREYLDVRVAAGRADVPGSAPLQVTGAGGPASGTASGCARFVTAGGAAPVQVRAHLAGPAAFSVRGTRSLELLLVDDTDTNVGAGPRTVGVPAGATMYVTTPLSGYELFVVVDSGAELCGLQLAPRLAA